MPVPVFKSGPFTGMPTTDTFALAALNETPVTVQLPAFSWPAGLAPTASQFAHHAPGRIHHHGRRRIRRCLLILYTDLEISALLEVFTGDSSGRPSRKKTWNEYGHDFRVDQAENPGIDENDALKAGYFGYLSLMTIGGKKVALYKTELHPKIERIADSVYSRDRAARQRTCATAR